MLLSHLLSKHLEIPKSRIKNRTFKKNILLNGPDLSDLWFTANINTY